MPRPPQTVADLDAEGSLARITLTWSPLGWEPLVDHYRVYARRGRHAAWTPDESELLAKTIYPQHVHDGQDPAGETWSYMVLAVDDAGTHGRPSAALTAASQASVTASGVELARAGSFDGRSLEFRFAPNGYARIPAACPEASFEFLQGRDDVGSAWPFLLPGPGDAWAGGTAYTAHWLMDFDAAPPGDLALALWLIDSTRLGGTLDVAINGEPVTSRTISPGATRGSREGDATVPGSSLVRAFHEFDVPADSFVDGRNEITLTMAEGGWVAWDAVGLYRRS